MDTLVAGVKGLFEKEDGFSCHPEILFTCLSQGGNALALEIKHWAR